MPILHGHYKSFSCVFKPFQKRSRNNPEAIITGNPHGPNAIIIIVLYKVISACLVSFVCNVNVYAFIISIIQYLLIYSYDS